jgi:rhodanese-related sulfurtransferase
MMITFAVQNWRSGLRIAVGDLRARLWLTPTVLAGVCLCVLPLGATAQQPAISGQVQQQVLDIQPVEIAKGISEGRYLLVDVREPEEVAAEAYPNAVLLPLSRFDPRLISVPYGQQVVFACRTGRRSTTASLAAQAAGFAYNKQLAGGMVAWKAAGLPTKRGP